MIYADYNGSAPICDDVKDYIIKRLTDGPFANPNAIHHLGQSINRAIENSRKVCSEVLGCIPGQITFNSGSTEGISQVFHSILSEGPQDGKNIIIISSIEHSAIVNNAKAYANKGFETKVLPATESGIIDLELFKKWMNEFGDQVAFVSIMAANNETGVVQPFNQIGKLCKEKDAPYFCDTTQYIGKAEFSFKDSEMDFAVCSGHKVGAMTGTGIVLAKDSSRLKEQVIGGGQERGRRGGTQHYLGQESLAIALDSFRKNLKKLDLLNNKRIEFEQKLKEKFPSIVILGEQAPRLASSTFLSLPGTHGQAVQIELESKNIYVTTSSACSDNEPVTSRVLKSMSVDDNVGRGAVRISLGLCSPLEWYDRIFEALSDSYEKLSKLKAG